MAVQYSKPPVLMRDVVDLDAALKLLETQAPYTPLGGWFSLGADPNVANKALWFQNDFVHDTFHAPGSEVFLRHEGYIEAAKQFYAAEVVEPQSVYVNLMVAIDGGGPAHTDNPKFHGRDRTNTSMWLLRAMMWSGLFTDYLIRQATAIWWLNDVEGGGLYYWADGPACPPSLHIGNMANTALFGDNHGMFHQVGPVGPFGRGPLKVTPFAELAPADDGTADWIVTDRGAEVLRAGLDVIRVSVLWKADVYRTAAERDDRKARPLSLEDVAATFNADLVRRGSPVRFAVDRVDDLSMKAELATVYPEAVPVGALAYT